jgi:hypothetical protein
MNVNYEREKRATTPRLHSEPEARRPEDHGAPLEWRAPGKDAVLGDRSNLLGADQGTEPVDRARRVSLPPALSAKPKGGDPRWRS